MFLDFWCGQTMRSRIESMARMLRTHRRLSLNYFKAKKEFPAAASRALTTKPKMRKSYGFRTLRILELALYHSLGKLPGPKLPVSFSDESNFVQEFP
jgi:hypothetical protein